MNRNTILWIAAGIGAYLLWKKFGKPSTGTGRLGRLLAPNSPEIVLTEDEMPSAEWYAIKAQENAQLQKGRPSPTRWIRESSYTHPSGKTEASIGFGWGRGVGPRGRTSIPLWNPNS